jgi:hypothetical protein
MEMVLERTALDIDILRVEVSFDENTQQRLRALARQGRSPATIARAASIAAAAPSAHIRMTFLRRVSLERFAREVTKDVRRATGAGMVDSTVAESISRQIPLWFARVEARGFRRGDRLLYTVTGSRVRTRLDDRAGHTLVTQDSSEPGAREALLGSFFAPGTSFRAGLVNSLF